MNSLMQSKRPITVLGAGGFVGSHLVVYMRGLGLDPQTPGKNDDGIFSRDLGYVVYCIGLTADYAKRPFDTIEAHTSLLARILKEATFESLVYLSSTRLYDSGQGGVVESQDLILNPHNPRHSYDLSKALGEWLCLHASNGKAKVARLASVYSKDLSDRNFLHTTLEQALIGRNFSLDSKADAARDYVYIDDVCEAILAILSHDAPAIYNVASGQNVSNRELFAMLQRYLGVVITPSQPGTGAKASDIDISRLKADFGLRPALLGDKLPYIIDCNKALQANGTC